MDEIMFKIRKYKFDRGYRKALNREITNIRLELERVIISNNFTYYEGYTVIEAPRTIKIDKRQSYHVDRGQFEKDVADHFRKLSSYIVTEKETNSWDCGPRLKYKIQINREDSNE